MRRFLFRFVVLASIWLGLGCAGTEAKSEAKSELQSLIEGMSPPFRIVKVSNWRDGGSIGFEVADKEDKRFLFCVCHIASDPGSESKWVKLQGRLFWGALHPGHDGARLVQTPPDEKLLLRLLKKAFDVENTTLAKLEEAQKQKYDRRLHQLTIVGQFLKKRGY